MRAAFGIDQLHVDLYLVAEAPHAAFQDITDPKVVADLLHIDRFPFEAEGGAAGDHEAVGDAREVGGQILGDGVSEIFLLRIVGQIGKRQHDDRERRCVDRVPRADAAVQQIGWRPRRSRQGGRSRVHRHRVSAHRPCNVLDVLLAHIRERVGELVADLIPHDAADTDPARLGEGFEPRGDVDAIAKDVVVVDDDVAEIDADAEFDALALGHIGVALGYPALDLGRTAHRIDDALELDEHPVAGGLDDAAATFGDLGVE